MAHTQLLSIKTVATRVGRSRSSIYADIVKGTFPRPLKIGKRASRWREEDIEKWINNLPVADFCIGGQP